MSDRLKHFLPDITVVIFNILNVVVSFIVITVLFGAEFTKAYVDFKGHRIEPADYAVHIEQTEEEQKVKTLPVKKDKKTGEELG